MVVYGGRRASTGGVFYREKERLERASEDVVDLVMDEGSFELLFIVLASISCPC